jgi:hypothetical protein
VLNIKAIGKKIKLVEKVNLLILMVILMKVIGKMIKLMGLVFIFTLNLKQDIKDIGKMI